MDFLEFFYDYFERPQLAVELAGRRRPLGIGLLGFVFGGLSLFAARALLLPLPSMAFGILGILSVLITVTYGFFLTAALHLIVEMNGKSGSAAGLFTLFGMAELSWALAVPLALVGHLLRGAVPGVFPAIFFAVGLTSFYLKARSLRLNYSLSQGKAWFVLCLPYLTVLLAIMAVGALAMVLAFIGLASQLSHLLG